MPTQLHQGHQHLGAIVGAHIERRPFSIRHHACEELDIFHIIEGHLSANDLVQYHRVAVYIHLLIVVRAVDDLWGHPTASTNMSCHARRNRGILRTRKAEIRKLYVRHVIALSDWTLEEQVERLQVSVDDVKPVQVDHRIASVRAHLELLAPHQLHLVGLVQQIVERAACAQLHDDLHGVVRNDCKHLHDVGVFHALQNGELAAEGVTMALICEVPNQHLGGNPAASPPRRKDLR
mmetsp:Transcript_125528/g.401980  ORF Transcript_125528/g.401980 Transcript_125528/m.401980 type:complete len:235 (-) Transcript_125528:12-716(-)